MGGVEDNEPPLKRVRSSPEELRCASNNSSLIEPIGSFGDTMAKSLPYVRNETVGSTGVIKKVEFVRIITKALYTMGYEKSGALLEEESGIPLHSPTVSLFMQQVLDGNWDESVTTLGKIRQLEDNVFKSATFLVFEQKFFELLENGDVLDALKTLRMEIAPLCIKKDRVHELAGCIISPFLCNEFVFGNKGLLHQRTRFRLLEELQKLLPPAVMVPERRLEYLVEQTLTVQRESCIFHNSVDSALSLYTDHQCGRDQIPTKTIQDKTQGKWQQREKRQRRETMMNSYRGELVGEQRTITLKRKPPTGWARTAGLSISSMKREMTLHDEFRIMTDTSSKKRNNG